MKFNLKNRPKQLVGKKGYADNSGYWEDDVAQWFEGFEKELREYLCDEDDTNFMFSASEIIKLILGEQQ